MYHHVVTLPDHSQLTTAKGVEASLTLIGDLGLGIGQHELESDNTSSRLVRKGWSGIRSSPHTSHLARLPGTAPQFEHADHNAGLCVECGCCQRTRRRRLASHRCGVRRSATRPKIVLTHSSDPPLALASCPTRSCSH